MVAQPHKALLQAARALRVPLMLLLLALALPCPAAAPQLPPPFKASYTVASSGLTLGVLERSFGPQGQGRYFFRSQTHATGIVALFRGDKISETSIWRFEDHHIKPLEYVYDHDGGKKERHVKVTFDWHDGIIKNQVGGQSWKMDIVPGVLDKLVYQLALMLDLEAGRRNLTYTIADGGKIKTYTIDRIGQERVQTPLGDFDAVKLQRHKPKSKRRTTLWCAPSLNYLPVKVEYEEKNGRITTAAIKSVKGL